MVSLSLARLRGSSLYIHTAVILTLSVNIQLNKQYPPIHFELPVSFAGYVDVGEVSGVVLGVTSSQNQLSSWRSSWISEIFTSIYEKTCTVCEIS